MLISSVCLCWFVLSLLCVFPSQFKCCSQQVKRRQMKFVAVYTRNQSPDVTVAHCSFDDKQCSSCFRPANDAYYTVYSLWVRKRDTWGYFKTFTITKCESIYIILSPQDFWRNVLCTVTPTLVTWMFLRHSLLKSTVSLKHGFGVSRGHWKWHHSIDRMQLHIHVNRNRSIATLEIAYFGRPSIYNWRRYVTKGSKLIIY